ncbi:MAG: hypothetical protein COC01_05540 [Bacteroidetes bacterium]|nr:hypothetical protein [Bacteroidia bacterium]PCH67521.1 MAG: hypothetical protein COC01_05540 [Bacteroidota bacterium]
MLALFGCRKVPKGFDKIKDASEVTLSVICMRYDNMDNTYIINEDSTYQKLLVHKNDFTSCSTYVLPEIDFANYTLIAKKTSVEGCNVKIDKNVYVNSDKKEYLYIIEVDETGDCTDLIINMNWMTLPKMEDDYELVIEVK